jgi:hypothetical protein
MAQESNNNRELTRAEILEVAAAQDQRRQEQITNQAKIISRLLDINQAYEEALELLAMDDGTPISESQRAAREALDKAAVINERHRKTYKKEKSDG